MFRWQRAGPYYIAVAAMAQQRLPQRVATVATSGLRNEGHFGFATREIAQSVVHET